MKIERSKLIQILKEEMGNVDQARQATQSKLKGLTYTAIREVDSCIKQKSGASTVGGYKEKLSPSDKLACKREAEDEVKKMLIGKKVTFYDKRYKKLKEGTIGDINFGFLEEYKKLFYFIQLPDGEDKMIPQDDIVKI